MGQVMNGEHTNTARELITIKTIQAHHSERLNIVEGKVAALEEFDKGIAELTTLLRMVQKGIKIWGPVLATAAITSGLVSGKWGAFLSALLTGSAPS